MGLFFRRKKRFFRVRGWLSFLLLLGSLLALWPPVQSLTAVTSLSDPAKLATLEKRGANPRVNKIVYWLNLSEVACFPGAYHPVRRFSSTAPHGDHGKLVARTVLRNLKIPTNWAPHRKPGQTPARQCRHNHARPYLGEQVEDRYMW